VSPKLSVTPPIAILEFTNALLGILVREAPEPLKVVAVMIPVILTSPVPVISLLLRSKFPPSCGVVSPKISVVQMLVLHQYHPS
jgi:hypothetical protein